MHGFAPARRRRPVRIPPSPPTRWYRCTSMRSPGFRTWTLPREANTAYRLDYGPNWRDGILAVQPPHVGKAFPVLVPQVDADGNELGGIHLPEISVPLATYTGWNLRDPSIGGAGQRVAFEGSYLPFPETLLNASSPATRANRSPSAIPIVRPILNSSRVPLTNSSGSAGFCRRIVHPCCSAAGKSGTRSRTNRTSGQLQGTIFNQNSAVQISDRRAA